MQDSIAQRLQLIQAQLPPQVRLIAVSKQVSLEKMRLAYAAGVRDFGESQVQEVAHKHSALSDLPGIRWHLIGHLQSNKVRPAIELFDWIHSVDDLKLAQRLDRLAGELGKTPKVCLQVKLLPDPNKYGWEVDALLQDLKLLNQCQHLQILGLMTILPFGLAAEEALRAFEQARELADRIRGLALPQIQMQELSMGMSGDYPQAVAAGATMVRLGTILFGDRPLAGTR
ncbi:YggS family pyridoxal phosphate-dependent enzyme [Leptolyngbya sp. FACHB-261]|nr:YggS family pyridoxal phosphate-dependent enzyme [Leptolyngbya sp. FACHB-261]